MPRSTRSASYLCLLLAIVPACSDRGSDGGSQPDPDAGSQPDPDAASQGDANADVDPSTLCAEYARLDCDDYKRCNSLYLDWNFGSYEACLARTEEECKVWSKLPGQKVNTPELIACMQAWHARSCNDSSPPPAACSYPPGELASGAGCQVDRECASGYCRRTGRAGCGTCADRLPDGAACVRRAECASGRCERQVCGPVPKEGDPCVGIRCNSYLVCADGICKPFKWVNAGERCDAPDIFCGWASCIDGVCVADKVAEVGESCAFDEKEPFIYCRDGECSPATNRCEKRPVVGATCSDTGTCAGTAICAGGQCKELSAEVCKVPATAARESSRSERAGLLDERPARVRDPRLLGFRD
jgi:hypothetical protein